MKHKQNFVIDYLRGVKISRGGVCENIVRYFDPPVQLGCKPTQEIIRIMVV